MREHDESRTQYAWIVYAIATVVFGGLTGYVIAVEIGRTVPSTVASTTVPPQPAPSPVPVSA
jgi:hypothetical protein